MLKDILKWKLIACGIEIVVDIINLDLRQPVWASIIGLFRYVVNLRGMLLFNLIKEACKIAISSRANISALGWTQHYEAFEEDMKKYIEEVQLAMSPMESVMFQQIGTAPRTSVHSLIRVPDCVMLDENIRGQFARQGRVIQQANDAYY